MPYRDPEDRRRNDRDRKRALRAAERMGIVRELPGARIRVVADVEALLAEAVQLVRSDQKARGVEKARALGFLGSIALRLIEAHDLDERIDTLEQMLDRRKTS
jgi:hypothetical protein